MIFNNFKINNFKTIRYLSNNKKIIQRNRWDQHKFRKGLIYRYKDCPITNIHSSLCDACHIFPFYMTNYYDRYNLDNGVLLSKHLHSAFDKRYFTFDQKSSKVKILYNNLEKMNITDLNTIGLENMDGLYVPQLDNKESRIYLSMINNLYV